MKLLEIRRRLIENNCEWYSGCSVRKKNGCFNGKYPVGHPKWSTNPLCRVAQEADGMSKILSEMGGEYGK